MESQRRARERNGGRKREGEGYKRLSTRKHGVSLSSHMWNSLSGQSEALMEINRRDITATFETDQHSPSLFLSFSLSLCAFSVSILSLKDKLPL